MTLPVLWARVCCAGSQLHDGGGWQGGLRVSFPEPCTLPAVNAVKITSYLGGVFSAVVVLVATAAAGSLSGSQLWRAVLVGWAALVAVAVLAYGLWYRRWGGVVSGRRGMRGGGGDKSLTTSLVRSQV
jgi:hypothetical protein